MTLDEIHFEMSSVVEIRVDEHLREGTLEDKFLNRARTKIGAE